MKNTAINTYNPVYAIINEIKTANKKEQMNLMAKLFAAANEAMIDLKNLDAELKMTEKKLAEMQGQINNLQVLMNM